MILITIPVYNEEKILEKNSKIILDFCRVNLHEEFKIIISDNNSQDRTGEIGRKLAETCSEIDYNFISQQGKGMAIKSVWEKYQAEVYIFMDADLSTGLSALPDLIKGISNGYDLAIGNRFDKKSKLDRPLLRRIISRGYRLVLKVLLRLKVQDLPCGFKAINQKVKDNVLPQIKNQSWFFDSELVILAEKQGFKIKQISVAWKELGERKSRVNTFKLMIDYFQKVLAMRKRIL